MGFEGLFEIDKLTPQMEAASDALFPKVAKDKWDDRCMEDEQYRREMERKLRIEMMGYRLLDACKKALVLMACRRLLSELTSEEEVLFINLTNLVREAEHESK